MKHANKNLLLVAAITSLLIMGTSIIPMQSYADNHKKTSDSKSSIKESSQIDKKNANQKMDQDNFCYRDDQCKQGNEGQQIVGKDNEASGFNDQSKTIEQSVTPTPTQASTPTPTPTPTPKTCEQCFRSVLSAQQIGALNEFFGGDAISVTCDSSSISEGDFTFDLSQAGISSDTAKALIECLKAAGLVFVP